MESWTILSPDYRTFKMLSYFQKQGIVTERKGNNMKGYTTANGYMGYVKGSYILFASEQDYKEYLVD